MLFRKLNHKEKNIRIGLFEHSTNKEKPLTKIAECRIDVFQYLLNNEKPALKVTKIKENKSLISTVEKYAILDTVDGTINDAPKLGFSIDIKIKNLENFRDSINARTKYLAGLFAAMKKEIERVNTKLVQHIAAFSCVGFDESRIYVVGGKKNSFACFSTCSKSKNKKNCLIF